jgi:hypothetical protein
MKKLLSIALTLATTTASTTAGPSDETRSQSESGVTLIAEVFCSETRLRTANVRLRWSLSPAARSAAGVESLAAASQSVDATVFAGGFEKGLYVTLAVPAATPPKPVAATPQASAQASKKPLRAFQIQLIEVLPTPAGPLAAGVEREMGVVIEDLEPGVNYTWRLNLGTASGKLVSAPLSVLAPTCPADMVQPKPRRVP